jgi:virginiamycin A acetyltransferase
MPVDQDLIKNQRKNGSFIESTASLLTGSNAESPIHISANVLIYGHTQIGKFTNINAYTVIYSRTYVGRFCSIGRNCHLGLAAHPTHFLSSHSFQYSKNLFSNYPDYDKLQNSSWNTQPGTHIGNDVWIGNGVQIQSKVTIGDGSIIGAGAVVTKDVPPYGIVGGVPAKIIRYRFPDNIISELLNLQWWDIDIKHLQNTPYDNIKEAIKHLKEVKNSLQE